MAHVFTHLLPDLADGQNAIEGGAYTEVPERVIALVVAFIAGGIVLNVLKEELPGERHARMLPLLTGAGGFTVLLQFT